MSMRVKEAMMRIEGHRRAIREHITKYETYPYPQDKDFALKTIRRCQEEIRSIKIRCNGYIPPSYEDSWTSNYYALNKEELLVLRQELLFLKQELTQSQNQVMTEEEPVSKER